MNKKVDYKKLSLAYFISFKKNIEKINIFYIKEEQINEYNEYLIVLEEASNSNLENLKVKEKEFITNISEDGIIEISGIQCTSTSTSNEIVHPRYYPRLQLLIKLDTLLILFKDDVKLILN